MRKNGEIPGKAKIAAHQNIKEKTYWMNQLSGQWKKSRFPYDYIDKGEGRGKLESFEFQFPESLASQLMKLSRGTDHTLHMILTAGIMLLLHKYTGSDDLITGTPVYKQDIDPAKMINTALVLRIQVRKGMNFKEFLLLVRETIFKATENYRYPLEILAEQLNKKVCSEDFPFFEVGVLLKNIHDGSYLKHIPLTMLFSFDRTQKGVTGLVTYDGSRFVRNSIEGIISSFIYLLDGAISNPGVCITDLSPMSSEERYRVLELFNDTDGIYPEDKTITRLFEEQVEKTPFNTALVQDDRTSQIDYMNSFLSYKKINEGSNRIAHFLRIKGVRPDIITAILIEPCTEMVIGILAILKAGGGYLPIDPATPPKRLKAILEDSHVEFLLTISKNIAAFPFVLLRGFEKSSLQVHFTVARAPVENLDGLQFPDRSLIDYEQYRPYIGQAMVKNSITIHMSRGCVYNCAYCFKIWPKQYVLRSAENIFQEIELYYRMGIRRFAFVDDLPNINIEESSKLFKLIIQKGLKVHLHFPNGIRGDILTPEYIDLMVEAGTITMDLALETTSKRLQKLVRKNLNLKKLEENVQYIAKNHPQVILELQILHGIPSETEAEARDSLEFIKRIKWVHFPYIHVLNIYPHSDMARIAISQGISREAIDRSADLAYHELPETLPFSENFTRKYQAEFLNEYFMAKERLIQVLPYQMNVLTEDELVQKYNSYLPVEIKSFSDLLDYAGITRQEIKGDFLPPDYGAVPEFNKKLKAVFPRINLKKDSLRILLLDLSQYFTHHSKIRYDVVEPPLGLIYLLSHLYREFGNRIYGKIAKSRMDFDSFEQLRTLITDFKPHIIGIRTLNFYKDFFHEASALIKLWHPDIPVIAGGPYATSNTDNLLKDCSIDIAVIGEGEKTFAQLCGRILENNNKLPDFSMLKEIPGLAFIDKKKGNKGVRNREVVALDRLSSVYSSFSEQNPDCINNPSDLVYTIYTSGTTGIPKGVLAQHNHLANQLMGLQKRFNFNSGMNYLLLTAYTFDVSVMHIFLPLITGAKVHIIGEDIRKNSLELWRFVFEKKIDILNIVPAYMKILLHSIENKLIHLKYLFVGGEIFDTELYFALKETFAVDHIINIYGPTESTINATLFPCQHVEGGRSIPIGRPLMNYRVYILNGDLKPVPVGATGELCVGGKGITRGYLNRPEFTAERFLYFNKSSLKKEERIYKTGDQVRWLPDGNIEFIGRIDRQVKVRGFRIELREIELQLLKHKQIKEVTVIPRADRNGDRYLCAYVVPAASDSDDILNSASIKAFLQDQLPHYMVPAYYVILDGIPLTSSGKIDKKMLPDPEKKDITIVYTAPRNEIEEELVEIWAEVMAADKSSIGIDTNFFELGGHSLKATILISRIHKRLNIKIPLALLFQKPTIRGITEYIGIAEEEIFQAIEPVEKREYYPLSSTQKRMLVVGQMVQDTIAYNMSHVVISEDRIDFPKLEQSFKILIRRHESLRTSFRIIQEQPVQMIHDEVKFRIEYYEISEGINSQGLNKEAEVIRNFIRPFELSSAPLLRVGIIKSTEDRNVIMIDLHHIITDGISQELLTQELLDIYGDKELLRLKLQYKDYAQWQTGDAWEKIKEQQEKWWIQQFQDEIPLIELPLDYSRPHIQSFKGDRLEFFIDQVETNGLNTLASQEGTTLFMVLSSIFNVFLSKISGNEDIVMGTPVAGRRHADLKPIIGMFVNTLALRGKPRGRSTFRDFLHQFKENTLQGFENQEYPFEDLVDRLSLNRNTSRNPLFDVIFTLYNVPVASSSKKELKQIFKPYGYQPKIAKFDMTLFSTETQGKLVFNLEYCTDLFKRETIQRFSKYFRKIATHVLKEPGIKLFNIEIIDEGEKQQILRTFNDTFAEYPWDKTIHELFSLQANVSPDRVALIRTGRASYYTYHLTYRELNQKSTQVDGLLKSKSIDEGGVIGIIGEPSLEMVIGIIGILKSGNAYLPIDPDYPDERINYMLTESHIGVLVTASEFNVKKALLGKSLEIIDVNAVFTSSISSCPSISPSLSNKGNPTVQLAYIMYTSGSTGRPKGVMVKHRNVARLVKNSDFVSLNSDTRILQTGAPVFDATTFEIWGSLLNGGQLVLCPKNIILDAFQMAEMLIEFEINTLWLSSPLFNRLVRENSGLFKSLVYLLVGGDVLSPSHISTVKREFPALRIINGYGPTENTTFSTTFSIEREFKENIPIGKPVTNSTAYIVDGYMNLLAIGLVGELWVGGEGVALGYLNNPELTSIKFISGKKIITFIKKLPTNSLAGPVASSPIYGTGDLARWLPDGNIEFIGRKDHQVKIRGFRIESEEIEHRLLCHDKVKEAVVMARQMGGTDEDKDICAYIVPTEDNIEPSVLKDYLSQSLPGYMIPSFFVLLNEFPLTANGKIDRHALPAPEISESLEEFSGPRDEIERQVAKVWAENLNLNWETIGIDLDFFDLGGHSLKAVTMIAKIHRIFNVKISLADFFSASTIREMSRYIRGAVKTVFSGLKKTEKKEFYPLSFNQKRLFFVHQLEPQSYAYNMPAWLTLPQGANKRNVASTVNRLIERHESLRTGFRIIDNAPVQFIVERNHVSLPFEFFDISGLDEREKSIQREQLYKEFSIAPFDLENPPLFRSALLKLSIDHHELIFNLHHIISDGWSFEVLEKEFTGILDLEMKGDINRLKPLKNQYKDYVQWQNHLLEDDESISQAKAFWKKHLTESITRLNLPYDQEPNPSIDKETASYSLVISESFTQRLRQLAKKHQASLFMVLLAGLNLLLARITGQKDIIVAIPAAARQHEDLKDIIGMFVNTLILKNRINNEETFLDFFYQFQRDTLQVLEYQSYPLELICSELGIKYPEISVFFNMVNIGNIDQEDLVAGHIGHKESVQETKFEWVFYVREYKNGIKISCHYFKDLFMSKTIEKVIQLYLKVLEKVLMEPGNKIGAYNLTGKRKELKRN